MKPHSFIIDLDALPFDMEGKTYTVSETVSEILAALHAVMPSVSINCRPRNIIERRVYNVGRYQNQTIREIALPDRRKSDT